MNTTTEKLTEQKIQDYLVEVLDYASSQDGMVKIIDTFEELGMMTNNKGLVITMQDGTRFQLIIAKSR
jgi:hypothetical protein